MAIRHLKKVSDTEKNAMIEALKTYLNERDEVVFALLYGSLVDPVLSGTYGDIDLGLYVRADDLITSSHVLESRIEAEARRFLSSKGLNYLPVEASVLNNAPFPFLVKLFKGKYLVLKENEQVLTDFIEEVGREFSASFHFRAESLREVVGD
jgi:predicted nucleotidyltransferase